MNDSGSSKYRSKKKTQYNIILVCHTCLKELIIPNEEFEPFSPTLYDPAKEWVIPLLVRQVIKDRGPWAAPDKYLVSAPASDVRCYCPEHASNVEEVRKEFEERENGEVAELDDCASFEN